MDHFAGRQTESAVWVRAMYSYESDDQTNLSFHAGDIIQVLTILESGWWDGIVHGQRGWFPSNYCRTVTESEANRANQLLYGSEDESGTDNENDDSAIEDDGEDEDEEVRDIEQNDNDTTSHFNTRTRTTTNDSTHQDVEWHTRQRDQEEASFWIPQVTEDGTLFYHNTLTGVSTMELPLETPENGNGLWGSGKSSSPVRTRNTSQFARSSGGRWQDQEDERSSSDADYKSASESPVRGNRHSYISDGASPSTSMESLSMTSTAPRSRLNSQVDSTIQSQTTSMKSRNSGGAPPPPMLSTVPVRFLDYTTIRPVSWDLLLDDVRTAVDRFRRAILHDERSEYVRRAEDISDHVRLILAAGSGTTDNHSGTPSIITSNKALYARFRDMMSRFARLVLNAHINAGEFSPQDGASKCLQDADGVMDGVYGYIEVARTQRGEDIPRVFPGFIGDHYSGGNWKNNGLRDFSASGSLSFADNDDYDNLIEPDVRLDTMVLDQMDVLRREIVIGLNRLSGQLIEPENLLSRLRHMRLSHRICAACEEVLDLYRPWMASLESITLSPMSSSVQAGQLTDFAAQKQQVYNLVADLVMVCQAVGAPLADEWASDRGLPLDARLKRARSVSQELETATTNVSLALQVLLDSMPSPAPMQSSDRQTSTHKTSTSVSSKETGRTVFSEASTAVSFPESVDTSSSGMMLNAGSKKLQRIFGQVPMSPGMSPSSSSSAQRGSVPRYMLLDHEGEIQYDPKTDPPSVKGGTITALVEQLTRHDTHQDNFRITFLLTFRSFTSAQDLFLMLVQRWSIQPPLGLTEEEYSIWAEKKQAPIRFRVCNTLKLWIESFWMEEDTQSSRDLLNDISDFAQNTIETSNMPWAKALARALDSLIEKRLKGQEPHAKKLVASFIEGPAPKLPKNMKKFKITDIDPAELARQLTIIESRLYCAIKPQECLDKAWAAKITSPDADQAPNVRVFIRHSNQLTYWVISLILGQTELKKRAALVKHLVAVGENCLQMNNFSTLTAIVSAFSKSPVFRLHRTWSAVDKKTRDTVARMRQVTDSTKNFKHYRDLLHHANPPVIPFLGIYLQDLTFMEDGNPSFLKHGGLINFNKRTKIAEVIREILNYQNITYPFKTITEIQSYITDKMQHTSLDDEVHYAASAKVEPREREDDKIAR